MSPNICRAIAIAGACLLPNALVEAQPVPKGPVFPVVAPASARIAHTIGGLDGPGFAMAYNEEAGILAVACERNTIQYWHRDVLLGVRVGEGTPNILLGHEGPITGLAWNGGPYLVSGGADKKLIVWQVADAKIAHVWPGGSVVRALAMSPDGKLVAWAGDDPMIQIAGCPAGKVASKLTGHTDWVQALTFSPDGKWLASGGYDGVVRLWDVTSGTKLRDLQRTAAPMAQTAPVPVNTIFGLSFSPDSKLLAVGGSDAEIHVFNAMDGKMIRSLTGHTSTITSIAFHPGGSILASGSRDSTIRLWNVADGQMLKTLEGHTAWVNGISFLAQGTRLASVGADQNVMVWDLTAPK